MILSHQKQFIFIHIYKVAGTSIRRVLEKYDDRSYKDLPFKDNVKRWIELKLQRSNTSFLTHLKASEIKSRIKPEIFNSYFKFSFVRNPWDWQVSLYYFMLQNHAHRQHKLVSKMKNFEEYLDWRINKDLELQREFVFDESGNQIVDYIGYFENIQEDFSQICEKLQIPHVELPVVNSSQHRYYKEYYSDKTKQWVAEAFKKDIETFGYSF